MKTLLIDSAGRPTEWAYCVPAVVFAVGTSLEGYAPPDFYPVAYGLKALAVGVALYICRPIFADLQWNSRVLPLATVVGLAGFAIWVGIEAWVDYPRLGERSGYNPFSVLSPAAAVAFVAVRLAGLVVLVPLFEELLWRSFLIRYITSADFQRVPHGAFSALALAVVCGAAAVSHAEWLSGLVFNAMVCGLLYQTRSVLACVVAHALTNAALGAYVLGTGAWQLW